MKKFVIYNLVVLMSGVVSASAIGLSVSPRGLKVDVNAGESGIYKLKVKNPSGEVALFEVYPDDFRNIIETLPASFILEGEEVREVTVRVSPKEDGVFRTNISVVATPIAKSGFNAGSGVKIPLEVNTSRGQSLYLAMISTLPLVYSRILGISLLILIVGISFIVLRYAVKQIKS